MSHNKNISSLLGLNEKNENLILSSQNLSNYVSQYVEDYLNSSKVFPFEGGLYDLLISEIDRALFQAILNHTHNNQSRTAEIIGINRSTLRKKLKKLGWSDDKRPS